MTATAGKTFYQRGLIFKAHKNAQGHVECCFSGAPEMRNVDGSLLREAVRPLFAEFGVYGSEYMYEDPLTGTTDIGSTFRGGYFSLDERAEAEGWDDREKEIVARHMLTLIERRPGHAMFSLYSQPKVAAPWPTYDSMAYGKIGETAETLGFLAEALLYEEQNKARVSVVGDLKDRLSKAQTEPVDELVAG